MMALRWEIFADMARDLIRCVQTGQHVDELQDVGFERRVCETPGQHLRGPAIEDGELRVRLLGAREQVAADGVRALLKPPRIKRWME